ncbi:ABC transporter substrate-binding protein [Cognatishimia sp. F0-27]|uniref:ABC transporter substrate-binding protein n=1 Tax=Cognatishimia sp. F0-27 TaxID=2816855 RepID=UPI001D0C4F3A|nr:ABC transporter substrate-binding protein [Cognatishimia sp. F0-27]MCC1493262.1 ABC transporter substrate-binding protein [Cognatishimia sp. F0-27]
MDKFIYAVYLVVTTIGLTIGLRLLWSLARGEKLRFRPLMGFLAIIGLIAGYYFWERQDVYDRLAQQRLAQGLDPVSPVHIAGVWPADDPDFFEGLRAAVAAINADGGVTVRDDSGADVTVTLNLIEFPQNDEDETTYLDVAEDRRILAVVGHRGESEAIRASAAYEEAGLLYLAPTVSRPNFSEHGFRRVLRLVPDDDDIANHIADFVNDRGYRNIVALTPRTEAGKNMARYLSSVFRVDNSTRNRVDIPRITLYRSYEDGARHFHELVTDVEEADHSVILIADDVTGTARLVRALRSRNVDAPIVGFPIIEVDTFFEIAGDLSNGVVIPSLLPVGGDPDTNGAKTRITGPATAPGIDVGDFVEVQAYESVMLLSNAWERAGTIEAGATAAILRAVKGWKGLHGSYDFTPDGDITDRAVQLKQSRNGRFHPIAE